VRLHLHHIWNIKRFMFATYITLEAFISTKRWKISFAFIFNEFNLYLLFKIKRWIKDLDDKKKILCIINKHYSLNTKESWTKWHFPYIQKSCYLNGSRKILPIISFISLSSCHPLCRFTLRSSSFPFILFLVFG
jgi:hypothetical protein